MLARILAWLFRSSKEAGALSEGGRAREEEQEPVSPPQFPAVAALELSGQQRALHDALDRDYEEAARMYIGALQALRHTENPERFVSAAHELREIMEKLPAWIVNLDTQTRRTTATEDRHRLEDQWEAAKKNSACWQDGCWTGSIDRPLGRYLEASAHYFKVIDEIYPRMRKLFCSAFERIDGAPVPLPRTFQRERWSYWSTLRQYFIGVAHHGKTPAEDEFLGKMSDLERFLLERLSPAFLEDVGEIDDLIREVENGD